MFKSSVHLILRAREWPWTPHYLIMKRYCSVIANNPRFKTMSTSITSYPTSLWGDSISPPKLLTSTSWHEFTNICWLRQTGTKTILFQRMTISLSWLCISHVLTNKSRKSWKIYASKFILTRTKSCRVSRTRMFYSKMAIPIHLRHLMIFLSRASKRVFSKM